jgi:hypothetical protein
MEIFIPIVAIWLWGLRNNNLFYNFLQFLYPPRNEVVGRYTGFTMSVRL